MNRSLYGFHTLSCLHPSVRPWMTNGKKGKPRRQSKMHNHQAHQQHPEKKTHLTDTAFIKGLFSSSNDFWKSSTFLYTIPFMIVYSKWRQRFIDLLPSLVVPQRAMPYHTELFFSDTHLKKRKTFTSRLTDDTFD